MAFPYTFPIDFYLTGAGDPISVIIACLPAGMTTGFSDTDNFYVKTWYTGDPLAMPSFETPSGAVIRGRPQSRLTEFVGEDTVTDNLFIRFYQPAVRKNGEPAELAAGYTRLTAMYEIAVKLLRVDPTFNSTIVNSEITNIDPLLPGVPEANAYRVAEITMKITRRALWGK